ncbi:MAG: 2Fe-2S iron-sulfur cluster binding domain-containing protein, partial [Bacilli bacterium]|nr:2Fe-2S iron-sulfur cluster binding domain-containing protein [Bacilli bacterium]
NPTPKGITYISPIEQAVGVLERAGLERYKALRMLEDGQEPDDLKLKAAYLKSFNILERFNVSGDNFIESSISKVNNLQYVTIKKILQETLDTKSFVLVPDEARGMTSLAPFKAGQFVSLKIYSNDRYATKPCVLSCSPSNASKNMYQITINLKEKDFVNELMNEVKEGDSLTISRPMGDFIYNKIRDEKNIIGIANGCGIVPFMALAEAINEGLEDCKLTVFYSVNTVQDIIFKEKIESINKTNKNVKFVITLLQETAEGYMSGAITKEMIEPYMEEFNSFFMCGSSLLYKAMNEVLTRLEVPLKAVHYDTAGVSYMPVALEAYELKVILKNGLVTTTCQSNESLLVAMEKAGIKAPSACRVGTCGFCRSVLLDGKIKIVGGNFTSAELANDYIHPCITYPESNVILRLDI